MRMIGRHRQRGVITVEYALMMMLGFIPLGHVPPLQ